MDCFNPQRIIDLRANRKLSQKDLGKRLGITDRAISKWEQGLSTPSSRHLLELAKVFGVSVETFFSQSATKKETEQTGMESLYELYKIGRGPSSSHTIGPERACRTFKERNADADTYKAVLYGSLAKTGKGHGTDAVIQKTFSPVPCEIVLDTLKTDLPHPNTMTLHAFQDGREVDAVTVYSIGGGSIVFEDDVQTPPQRVYALKRFDDIAAYCKKKDIRLWEYVLENEETGFYEYMQTVWSAMKDAVRRGLDDEGILPGGLQVAKKAKALFSSQHIDETAETRENRMVCAYAYAVGEQNAAGETIVTAPTCGAAGVVPAVLYYQQKKNRYSDDAIIRALMTAGLMGNIIKTSASISGAECGCQAEVGSACAMASAALAELFELSIEKIEYAAEIAIEHHLGLTCDPICGLVQIPCIERNAVAAMRAINAVSLSSFLWDSRKISFDKVVKTMKETGHDMHVAYKETSEGGLARIEV